MWRVSYLEGEPLSARIRRGALTWSEAFPILEQTLRALKAAHDKGFVHRDLEPDNIWLKYEGRVQVKLLDFGIARLVGSESPPEKLTQIGSGIGTPHDMSPEQISGSRDIDQRTDIYALGVIIDEMFVGITPFAGDTLQAIMTDDARGPVPVLPPILTVLVSHVPGGWTTSRSLDDLFGPRVRAIPGLSASIPRSSLIIDDLAGLSNAGLKARSLAAKLALWLLRDARAARRLLDSFDTWIETFADARGGRPFSPARAGR
jgi:serine/threonine protein kinase